MLPTHSLCDCPFLDIDLEHAVLASCDEDLSCALGGEVHTLQVLEVVAPAAHTSACSHDRPKSCRLVRNVREVPLCYAAPVRVVDTLLRNGQDALLGEEELLDRPVGGGMAAVRGVAFERWAVERGNAPLYGCKLVQLGWVWRGRAHEAIAGPQQLLRRVKGKGRYRRGRVVRSRGRQLHDGELYTHQLLNAVQSMHWTAGASCIGGALPRPSPPPCWQRVHRCSVPVTQLRHASDILVVSQKASRGAVNEVEATRRVDA